MVVSEVNKTILLLRSRLCSYRDARDPNDISIHLSSVDVVISLVEFGVQGARPIAQEEELWFNAGYMLDILYRNSEWSDIVDMYYELVAFAKSMNFFRPTASSKV